jgi:hypothetical protein
VFVCGLSQILNFFVILTNFEERDIERLLKFELDPCQNVTLYLKVVISSVNGFKIGKCWTVMQNLH